MGITAKITRKLSRPISRYITEHTGSGSVWYPSKLSNLMVWTLDNSAYDENGPINGTQVLKSKEPYGDYRQPRQGRCVLLDGVNDHGVVADNGLFNLQSCTFTAWIKTVSTIGVMRLQNIQESGGQYLGMVVRDGRLTVLDRLNSITYPNSSEYPLVNTGAWTHCTAVKDTATGNIRLYVNGGLTITIPATNTTSYNFLTSTTLKIGGYGHGANAANTEFFNGSMRDVRIYNVAKSADQVAAIHAGADDTDGCLGHWPMEEESGLTAYNLIAGGPNITWNNITQSTFHATDSAITSNRNNEYGCAFGNNLIPSSEVFTSGWSSVTYGSAITAVADNAADPDGGMTADTITFPDAVSGSGQYAVYRRQISTTDPGTYTFSVWLSAPTPRSVYIRINDNGGNRGKTLCNLTSTPQRFSVTATTAASITSIAGDIGADGNAGEAMTAGTVVAWGAQLEKASTVSRYTKTTGTALSGVYIPKRLGSDLAADGGALSVTGPCPYPVSTSSPCVTGDGTSYIDHGSALIPDGATEFVYEIDFYLNSTTQTLLLARRGNTTNGLNFVSWSDSVIYLEIWVAGARTAAQVTLATAGISAATWYRLKIDYDGSRTSTQRLQFYVDGVLKLSGSAPAALGTMSGNLELMRDVVNINRSNGRLCNLAITTGGITTTFPLQDGIGDGTNRNIAYRRSDGTGGVIENAIVNGTLANIWANRTDKVQDECVNNGGRLAGLNMLTYSEQFDNAAWTKSGVTITPNVEVAPDGTITMDKWVESSGGLSHVMHQTKTVVSGTVYHFRIYAKAAENDYIGLYVGTANKGRMFNLATGVAGNIINNTPDSSSITHVGNGVYRCEITVTATSTSHRFDVYSSKDGTDWDYSGDGTSGVYIWGAQAYAGAADLDYVRTGASTRNNEFVLGLPNSNLCADGLPKTIQPYQFGNPGSILNMNPFSAAELNGRNVPTNFSAGSYLDITPQNSAFIRGYNNVYDRLIITSSELTGNDLVKADKYTLPSLPTNDTYLVDEYGNYLIDDNGDYIII